MKQYIFLKKRENEVGCVMNGEEFLLFDII